MKPGGDFSRYECVLETPRSRLPRLLMYVDSFSLGLRGYLSEHFPRNCYLYLSYKKDMFRKVEEEKPDVVILELAERYINVLLE